jgi:hypothetical protein
MVFKLLEGAQKSWRRLDGHNQLPKLVLAVTFNDGIEVIARDTALRLTPIIWATNSWDKSCIRKSQRANRDSAE